MRRTFSVLVSLIAMVVMLGAATGPSARAQTDPDLFRSLHPRSIGPAGMSGRIGAIDALASDPYVIYVGAATGGLWKSTDGGTTWRPLTDELPVSSFGAVAVNQNHPDIVWAGSGEDNVRNSVGVGRGMYKSMDGGDTWQLMGLEETEHISRIVLHPSDPDIAWVAATGRLWGDGTERGVFKTGDGGQSWTRVLYVDERTGAADLVIDPRNPHTLFAAMWEHRRWPWFFESGGPGSGLWVSRDGGENWTRLGPEQGLPAGELGRIGLAIAPSRPEVIYALVEAERSVLLRSEDGGRSFETVNRTPGIHDRPFYYSEIRVDPDNHNRVYMLYSLVSVSDDGGRSFEVLVPFAGVHADHHAMWIDPGDGRYIIDGNDGGVAISRDRGRTWTFIDNLPLAQFYHVTVDNELPYHVYGGMQDNGSWRGPSEVWELNGIRNWHWFEVGFGDGFHTVPDPEDATVGYAMSQQGYLIRWDIATGGRKDIRPAGPAEDPLRFNWNSGFAVDPFDPATIYLGSQYLHRSRDRGESWEEISPDLSTDDPLKQKFGSSGGLTYDATGAENHTTILSIAPSPVERGVIWVGTDDGNVQLTRDGGRNWENVVANIRGVPDSTWVPHIEASKFNAGAAWVVFDNHRRSDWTPYIFKTVNWGRSWEAVATPALDGFVHTLIQDVENPDLLLAGTEFGLWVTLDGGQEWWRYPGFPTVPVRALTIHPRTADLVIGTHGRAAWIVDDIRPLRELSNTVRERTLHLFTIPDTWLHVVRQMNGYHFPSHNMFAGENRPYGACLSFWADPGEGEDEVVIEISDSTERVLRTIHAPVRRGVNRVVWELNEDPLDPETGPGQLGPEVVPGTYMVTLHLGEASAQESVTVHADPRKTSSMTGMQDKQAVLRRAEALNNVMTEAGGALATIRSELETALGRIGELDEETAGELKSDLEETARALQTDVEDLRARFFGPEQVQGIYRDPEAIVNALYAAFGALGSATFDAPTPTERLLMERAEAAVAEGVEAYNALVGKILAFRDRLETAGVLWPQIPAQLAIPPRR